MSEASEKKTTAFSGEHAKGDLTVSLKAKAAELGFPLSGVTAVAHPARYAKLVEWLEAGYAGQMGYIEARREAYRDPTRILDGCRTLLMLGFPYRSPPPEPAQGGFGRVARYAQLRPDYHDEIHKRLKQLRAWLVQTAPGSRVRGVVDTAPLLERDFAEAAGIGWVGKNTLLLNRRHGSYFYLAALLTDLPLALDDANEKAFCGTCQACLRACPTQAFPTPYVLDATRCISYLTIETRDEIPHDFREGIGDWLLGCDICQEVCPWNKKTLRASDSQRDRASDLGVVDLIELIGLDEDLFRQRFRHTALWRPKRVGMLRNAAIILGNQRAAQAIPALTALLQDDEPVLRSTAAWALARIAGETGSRWSATT